MSAGHPSSPLAIPLGEEGDWWAYAVMAHLLHTGKSLFGPAPEGSATRAARYVENALRLPIPRMRPMPRNEWRRVKCIFQKGRDIGKAVSTLEVKERRAQLLHCLEALPQAMRTSRP